MSHRVLAAALAGALLCAPLIAGASGAGDAIFAVDESGALEPVAVRVRGAFLDPGSTDGQASEKLRREANGSIAAAGNRVHVIFGGRVVATVPATVDNGAASISVPPSLTLGGDVDALASPTLGGRAKSARRDPSQAERAAALAVAAESLGVSDQAKIQVRSLAALDLGRGTALAGTVVVKAATVKRQDRRLFFIAEPVGGRLRATLANAQTVKNDVALAAIGETLVDAIDLGDGALSVVTRVHGYDAHTFAIYSRTHSGWKRVYEGGGAPL
jgi:hypothetical protein